MEPKLCIARLYFDEDADARLAEALRRRGYDVETTVEAGLLEASDEQQLAYAVSQQRALVTHNIKDFPGKHARWVEAGGTPWGIIILIRGLATRGYQVTLATLWQDEEERVACTSSPRPRSCPIPWTPGLLHAAPPGPAAPGHPALLRPAWRQHRLALAGHYRRPVVMGDGEARRHGDTEGRKG